MRSLPEPQEAQVSPAASQIWEAVVHSMNEYTDDSMAPKFLPPEELLKYIRPVAAAFALLHYTPLPTMKEIYKSHLYTLFYFSMICGIQMYIKERTITTKHSPYQIITQEKKISEAKNTVMKQLTDGIKVFPPINHTMDIFLTHLLTPRRIERLPLKDATFDHTKFDKFMPVTLLWGYLFAREVITNI